MTKEIQLTQGQVALVDDEDYEWLNQWKWYASFNKSVNGFYAQRAVGGYGKQKMLFMHRVVMDTPKGLDCDHINHDTLDNQRSNLRNCTRSENMLNRKGLQSNNTSGVAGVSKVKNGFRADVTRNGKLTYLGTFKTIKEAERARNEFISLLKP